MERDAFDGYNPYINFIFYGAVIIFAVILTHPVLFIEGFISALSYGIYMKGKKMVKNMAFFIFPMMIIGALLNPVFNHRGETILFYFNDNPITLEAISFGIGASFMIGTVIIWFATYNQIMTSDKLMHIFGKIIPALNLIFSMVLRFVPRFSAQVKVISNAQKCVGRDVSNGNIYKRSKHGMKILSIMTTWALENAVDLADSMKSRGFGIKGRTSFLRYRFDDRDKKVAVVMAVLIGIILIGVFKGAMTMEYYPRIILEPFKLANLIYYVAYGSFCLIPVIMNIYEDIKWKHLQSEI